MANGAAERVGGRGISAHRNVKNINSYLEWVSPEPDPRAAAALSARLKNDLAKIQRAGERIGGNGERNLCLKPEEVWTAVG